MSRQQTVEQMRREIEQIRERIAEKGASPPVRFVEPEHSAAIVERVKVVEAVLTSYLQLINDSKAKAPFPSATFDKYRDLLALLEQSTESAFRIYGGLLRMGIELIADDNENYERTVTRLYSNLKLASGFLALVDSVTPYAGEDFDGIITDYMRQLKGGENE